jgi:diguanylate cyclase (GGDEF)-like protein
MPDAYRGGALLRWYTAVSLGLTAVYLLLPVSVRPVIFLLVTLGAVPAVAIGASRSPRGGRLPWFLLMTAMIFLNMGDILWVVYVFVQHHPTADGTIADFLFTIANVLLLSGALGVVVKRGRKDVGGIIDAAVVAFALGGLTWDALLLPHLTATGAPTSRQIALFTDVLVLMGILGALARVSLVAAERIPALRLLVLALLGALVGHVSAGLVTDPTTLIRPDWTNAIFLVAYVAVGCAALHPSARLVTCPGPEPKDELTAGRLVFLGIALAAIPVVGGGRVVLGLPTDGLLIALGSAAVVPMVMVRIARLSAQRARAERALVHLANHDPLTRLPNRSACMAALTDALDCSRGAAMPGAAVLFCDLDGFKPVNDRLGHRAGDELLAAVADRLRACVRDGDVVSRFGGDEFVVVCRSDRPREATELLCERIREALLRPFVLDGETALIGVSVGAAIAGAGATAEELINRADAAMYRAKQSKSVGALTLVMA